MKKRVLVGMTALLLFPLVANGARDTGRSDYGI